MKPSLWPEQSSKTRRGFANSLFQANMMQVQDVASWKPLCNKGKLRGRLSQFLRWRAATWALIYYSSCDI